MLMTRARNILVRLRHVMCHSSPFRLVLLRPHMASEQTGKVWQVGNSKKFLFWGKHIQPSWEDIQDANCHEGADRKQYLLF